MMNTIDRLTKTQHEFFMTAHDDFYHLLLSIIIVIIIFLGIYSIEILNNIDFNDQSTCYEDNHDMPPFFCEPPSHKPIDHS